MKFFLMSMLMLASCCIATDQLDPFEVDGNKVDSDSHFVVLSNEKLLELEGEELELYVRALVSSGDLGVIRKTFYVEDHFVDELRNLAAEKDDSIKEKALEMLRWVGDLRDFENVEKVKLQNSLEGAIRSYLTTKEIIPSYVGVELLNRMLSKAYIRIDYEKGSSLLYIIKYEGVWFLVNESPLKTII